MNILENKKVQRQLQTSLNMNRAQIHSELSPLQFRKDVEKKIKSVLRIINGLTKPSISPGKPLSSSELQYTFDDIINECN
ncbi:hypothetical protein GWI33_001600 [Rhynchophorus ferrugineus]|uniref:Uncharacterized protein n=1 Tax=Rhynchophorus ferrugineus TaxID=354439 RepID=A0A834HK16_RHYFE|nr:hypothetical protein GWI33_001600 [Rhynchophorus ferrugineus]